ncbi:antibiotic biosynthesis monooxygenase [Acetobacter sp. DmW_043]|uniref:putative quinol monooxygenase n=1 Tax=Acetobacter sp. DmW_043 TaxID=1670658 RepID=UPI000A3931A1|nr:putative quinol monooxygenase [Acetobacter sp. DmW_043]OUI87451.1 antibiotic biosynthesis monooxygenase [Acetobacter sp. DmW_043]
MRQTSQGVTIVASFYLKKDYLDVALPVVAACVRASCQEATNFSYTCRRDINNPLHFVFIEHWQSMEAIQEHEKQPHFLALKAMLERGSEGPLTVTFLKDITAPA